MDAIKINEKAKQIIEFVQQDKETDVGEKVAALRSAAETLQQTMTLSVYGSMVSSFFRPRGR